MGGSHELNLISVSLSSVPPTVSQADVHRFISAPKTTFRQGVREKKTDTGRDREKDVRTDNGGEKARGNSETDRLPVGDTICQ